MSDDASTLKRVHHHLAVSNFAGPDPCVAVSRVEGFCSSGACDELSVLLLLLANEYQQYQLSNIQTRVISVDCSNIYDLSINKHATGHLFICHYNCKVFYSLRPLSCACVHFIISLCYCRQLNRRLLRSRARYTGPVDGVKRTADVAGTSSNGPRNLHFCCQNLT